MSGTIIKKTGECYVNAKNNIPVILLGCNFANALGMIKSIGEAGYPCAMVHHTKNPKKTRLSPDMTSSYVYDARYIADKVDEATLEALETNHIYEKKAVLIAADDYSASFIDRYQKRLRKNFRFHRWDGGTGALTRCMEKHTQKKLATESGFSVAQNWSVVIAPKGEKAEIPEDVIFPCFLKPEVSAASGMSKELMRRCDSAEELDEYFQQLSENEVKGTILIEEFLTIEEEFTIPGARLGETVVIPSLVRKLVTGKGKVTGLTVIGRAEDPDQHPELKSGVERLVTNMGIQGLFDVEIIRCGEKYYFNEINLRSSAATYAVTGSGCNLALLCIHHILKKEVLDYKMTYGKTFINEKPALRLVVQKDIAAGEYKKMKKECDICLLTGPGDEGSRKNFEIMEKKTLFGATALGSFLKAVRKTYKKTVKAVRKKVKRVYKKVVPKPVRRVIRRIRKKLRRGYKRFIRRPVRRAYKKLIRRPYRRLRRKVRKLRYEIKRIIIRMAVRTAPLKMHGAKSEEFFKLNLLLEKSFRRAMKRNNFEFTQSEAFVESLNNIIENGGTVLAAQTLGKYVGTISVTSPKVSSKTGKTTANIKHLGIMPAAQGLGIASKLLSQAEAIAKENGAQVIYLSTPQDNIPAIKFYEKNGFSQVLVFESSGGHPAVRLEKEI